MHNILTNWFRDIYQSCVCLIFRTHREFQQTAKGSLGNNQKLPRGKNGRKGSHHRAIRACCVRPTMADLTWFCLQARAAAAVCLSDHPCTYIPAKKRRKAKTVSNAGKRREEEPSHYYLSSGEVFGCHSGPMWQGALLTHGSFTCKAEKLISPYELWYGAVIWKARMRWLQMSQILSVFLVRKGGRNTHIHWQTQNDPIGDSWSWVTPI